MFALARPVVAAVVLAAAPAALHAAPVYLYNDADGGDAAFVTGNVPFARVPQSGGLNISPSNPFNLAFDATTPLSPASSYTGPVFYGGISVTPDADTATMNPTSGQALRVVNNSNDDRIQIQTVSTGAGTYTGSYRLAVVLPLDNDYTLSSLLVRHARNSTGLTGDSARLLIGDGTNWWASATSSSVNTAALTTFSIADTTAAAWRTFNPSTYAIGGSDVAMPDPISFVGVYFDGTYNFTTTNTGVVVIEAFNVDAVAFEGAPIPEPAAAAAMLMMGGLMLARRR